MQSFQPNTVARMSRLRLTYYPVSFCEPRNVSGPQMPEALRPAAHSWGTVDPMGPEHE